VDAAGRPGWLKPALILLTIAGVIGGVPASLAMALSRPEDLMVGWTSTGLLAFAAIWIVPLLGLLGLVLGWTGFVRHRLTLARWGVVIAVVPIAAEIGTTIWVMHMFDAGARHH
jgi:hypothetical protein